LTESLKEVSGVKPPQPKTDDHIYVYYPLTVLPEKRDDFRQHLLRHGFDSKITDMSDCSALKTFQEPGTLRDSGGQPTEDSLLEICVYPVISERSMRRLAQVIQEWRPV
jgi:dTDP-4-amino-4,6-dideoxygalactose transaminase